MDNKAEEQDSNDDNAGVVFFKFTTPTLSSFESCSSALIYIRLKNQMLNLFTENTNSNA